MKLTAAIIFLVISFLLKIQFDTAHASEVMSSSCSLPDNQTITVGCSYTCGKFNRWAIKRAAKKLKYKVNFIEMNKNYSTDFSKIDALVFPGGADINPKYYTKKLPKELKEHINSIKHLAIITGESDKRDPYEYHLYKEYFADSKQRLTPVLGICRGMQMLAVSQGIPLYLDIKEELGVRKRNYSLDRVYVGDKESEIYSLIKKKKFRGVEIHHQAVRYSYFKKNRKKFSNVNITALSHKNKIPEVIEIANRPVIGTQFHPEYTFGKVRRNVFKWLLKNACVKKQYQSKGLL